MSLKVYGQFKKYGDKLGRHGMSELVVEMIDEFDGTNKGAMKLAGQLKAICHCADSDDYWKEKVGNGYYGMLSKIYNKLNNSD